MTFRNTLLAVFIITSFSAGHAQNDRKFNPKRFETDLQQFIVAEAALSPQEAAAFFPIYKEMHREQRTLFAKRRQYRHVDPSDDHAAREAIMQRDALDIQIKMLQQHYHDKFCDVLSPGKVFLIIKAENKFHRKAFRRMAKRK